MININIKKKQNGEIVSNRKEIKKVYSILEGNVDPYKITQIWIFTNNKIRKVFSLISSCFGSGTWMSSEKWIDSELWKY